ncbi:MAG: quinone oxidoreductase [Polyangiaceae bacterium]|nr:quinone oxidoreductase [Polyangiaceae bacterium]
MKAIRVFETGGPEVMKLVEIDTPSPGPGEVLVRVEAAGVNFIDIYQRSGQYKLPLPIPLGLEGAGVVEAAGQGVDGLKPGDRVAWARGAGSYATHVVLGEAAAIKIPDGVDVSIAAAAMLQGMTAHYLAMSTYPLAPGDTCLIHAAAGGVGLLLCQIAKRAGAHVIGTAGTEGKAARAKAAGADEIILYSKVDFEAEVRRLTEGRGVSVVYDSVGKDTFMKSLACLRRRGMLVLFGQSSGPVPPFDPQLLAQGGSLFLTRPALHHYTATRDELAARAGDLFKWIAAGELKITIGATFPLSEAPLAHEKLGGRETTGKVLLLPGA